MNKQLKAVITGLCLSLMSSVAIADKPETVTVGFLNLVNAQLVTKSLGLVQKEMRRSSGSTNFGRHQKSQRFKRQNHCCAIWFNNSLPIA